MALHTFGRIYPPVNPVPTHIIATVRQVAFRSSLVFVARLDFFLIGVAIVAKRFLMAGITGIALLPGVKFMLTVKIIRLMV